jgi:hypothetical protein
MRKTKALAWALASVAALAMTPSASAAIVQQFSVNDTQTQNGHSITLTANGRILASDANSHTIQVDCSATAGQPAAAIGTPQCYLLGADGRRWSVTNVGGQPGMKSVTAGVLDVPRQTYRVCLNGHALFQDGEFMAAQLRCSP